MTMKKIMPRESEKKRELEEEQKRRSRRKRRVEKQLLNKKITRLMNEEEIDPGYLIKKLTEDDYKNYLLS